MPRASNIYANLKSIFHEPNRLAILSALSTAVEGLTFQELKEDCLLTDGNLSRHLKSLEEARVVKIRKTFVKNKPKTTVYLTERGRDHFIQYLQALEEVLKKATESVAAQEKGAALPLSLAKLLRT